MAEKKTKRLAFNFLRSYFDVFNELENNDDKVNFISAILNKQFLDEDPEELNFIVKLCYQSQKHAIEKSVKGWLSTNKTDMQGNPIEPSAPPKGSPPSLPKGQEEEQEEEQVKEKYIYPEKLFLENWSTCRLSYLNKPTHIDKLTNWEKTNFTVAVNKFGKEKINLALHGLFKQENIQIQSMVLKPNHFLENVDKYYQAEMSKEYELYGKKKKNV